MKISIPKPCQENWNEMLPEEKGRFCLSCQKCVTDFTKMSDKEVIDLIQKPNQCGRFTPIQLNRINSKLEQQSQFQFPRFLRYSPLLIALGFGGTLIAQEKEKIVVSENTNNKIHETKTDSIVLRKQILDADGFFMTDVLVQLKNSEIETYTDGNGFFELTIPKNDESFLAITDLTGYYQEYKISEIKKSEIIFKPINLEMYVTGMWVRKRTFTGKILHTAAWPFRQIGKIF